VFAPNTQCHAAHAGVAHFAQGEVSAGGKRGHSPLKPGQRREANRARDCGRLDRRHNLSQQRVKARKPPVRVWQLNKSAAVGDGAAGLRLIDGDEVLVRQDGADRKHDPQHNSEQRRNDEFYGEQSALQGLENLEKAHCTRGVFIEQS
jgi:hypothetical protein